MKVALIGGTGFVGSYIVDELIMNDHTPRILVREGSESKVIQPEKCEMINGDIDGNGIISVADFNHFQNQLAVINSYVISDINLDGNVTIEDFNLYIQNSSKIGLNIIRY